MSPGPLVARSSRVHDLFRVRQGKYRILYEVQDKDLVVTVFKIGHRRDVYR